MSETTEPPPPCGRPAGNAAAEPNEAAEKAPGEAAAPVPAFGGAGAARPGDVMLGFGWGGGIWGRP